MEESAKKKIRRSELVSVLSSEYASLPSGTRLPSNAELQQRFDCAPMTVVRALDELEKRGEIVRIHGKGTFAPCRELREVYILSPAPNRLWQREDEFLSKTFEAAARLGGTARVIYATTTNKPDDIDKTSLNRIPEYGAVLVDGYWYHHAFDFLIQRHCRVVYFNSSWDISALNACNTIAQWYQLLMPIREAIHEAVRRLHKRGRKRVFFLHKCVHCETMHILAFREAMAKCRMHHDPALELYCVENFQDMCETLDMRLNEVKDFDAIIACSPEQAEGALLALGKLNRSVPDDCSLVCLRECPRLASCATPITSIDSTPDTAGAVALELLASGIPMPQVKKLDYAVHDRGSI